MDCDRTVTVRHPRNTGQSLKSVVSTSFAVPLVLPEHFLEGERDVLGVAVLGECGERVPIRKLESDRPPAGVGGRSAHQSAEFARLRRDELGLRGVAYPIDTGRLQARHHPPFRNRMILVELLFEPFVRLLNDVEKDRRLRVSPGVMDNPNRCVGTLANRRIQ